MQISFLHFIFHLIIKLVHYVVYSKLPTNNPEHDTGFSKTFPLIVHQR